MDLIHAFLRQPWAESAIGMFGLVLAPMILIQFGLGLVADPSERALLPEFGLALYQQPYGRDVRSGLLAIQPAASGAVARGDS